MKTHRTNIVAIIFSFVMGIAYSPSHAAERFSASVQVVVTGDEQLKNETASYIRRELRSLNDVVIVDSGADWVIELLIAELTNGIGAKLGLAISVTIIPTFNNQVQ